MANFWDEDNDNDDEAQGDGPAALRKAYDKLKKDAQKLAAEKAAIEAERDSLKGSLRSRTVADLLQAKGVSPNVAKYVLQDVDDPTEESVGQWLADNADVFNVKAADSVKAEKSDDASQQPLDEEQEAPEFGAADLAALQTALQTGQQGGSVIPAGALGSLVADVSANAKTIEDVEALLNKHGIQTTSGYGA